MGKVLEMHGYSKGTPLQRKCYKTWCNIKSRCNNPNTPYYYKYGAKGIKVCKEWEDSFTQFLSDIGCPPSLKHTIDRIDSSLGYTKENCRWASYSEQNQHIKKLNKHGYTGIGFLPKRNKPWFASFTFDGDKIHLGYFLTKEEAAKEYDKAAKFYLKEFAVLNFPEDKEC